MVENPLAFIAGSSIIGLTALDFGNLSTKPCIAASILLCQIVMSWPIAFKSLPRVTPVRLVY